MRNTQKISVIVSVLISCIFLGSTVYSQEDSRLREGTHPDIEQEYYPEDVFPDPVRKHAIVGTVLETLSEEEKRELEELREVDPEAFYDAIRRKAKERGEYLKTLHEENPQAAEAIFKDARKRIHGRRIVGALIWEELSEEERQDLIHLREENPAEFREIMREKAEDKQEYLEQLKATDPQKFEEVLRQAQTRAQERMRKMRIGKEIIHGELTPEERERLEKLREEDPESFRRAVREKFEKKHEYLKKLREEDPEKFKEIIQKADRSSRRKFGRQVIGRELVFETLSYEEKKRLAQLKNEDPERYKEEVKELLAEKQEYLKDIKENDPERFQDIVHTARKRIHKRIETLREKDPEKFKQLMQQRRRGRRERMKTFCKENPQECQRIKSQRLEHIKTMLNDLREEDPESYERVKSWIEKKRQRRGQGAGHQGPEHGE